MNVYYISNHFYIDLIMGIWTSRNLGEIYHLNTFVILLIEHLSNSKRICKLLLEIKNINIINIHCCYNKKQKLNTTSLSFLNSWYDKSIIIHIIHKYQTIMGR